MFSVLSPKTGKPVTPGVDIYADGTCMIRTDDGNEFTRHIGRSKARRLLSLLETEGLFSISDELINRRIKEVYPSRGLVVVDGSDTRVVARSGTQSVRISRHALDTELSYFPNVPELRTVQKCVRLVYETAGSTAWARSWM